MWRNIVIKYRRNTNDVLLFENVNILIRICYAIKETVSKETFICRLDVSIVHLIRIGKIFTSVLNGSHF